MYSHSFDLGLVPTITPQSHLLRYRSTKLMQDDYMPGLLFLVRFPVANSKYIEHVVFLPTL